MSAESSTSSWGGWLSSQTGLDVDSLQKKASEKLDAVRETVKENAQHAAAQATEAAAAAAAAAERLRESSAQAEQLTKLQKTCCEFLQLSGGCPDNAANGDTDALCTVLRERGLQLVRSYEQACERGKAYKAQAKAESEKAERAKKMAEELHSRCAAALARIEQLEAGAPAALSGCATPAPSASEAAPLSEALPVAATPAFLRDAEDDLQKQQQQVELARAVGGHDGGEGSPLVRLAIVAASSDEVRLTITRA